MFKKHQVGIFLAAIIIMSALSSMMQNNWKEIEAENNAFAEDCNNRGGEAKFEVNARQCLGAKIPSKQTASK